MRYLLHPLRFLDTVTDHIVVVLGVLVLSQVPAYMDHYTQRLGGHVAEARRNVEGWQQIAKQVGKGDLDRLARQYLASDDTAVSEAGRKCLQDVDRYKSLSSSLVALSNAGGWERPLVFIRSMDIEVARAALASYAPGLPLHLEGLAYALIGLGLSILLYRGLRRATMGVCHACGRKLKRDKASEAAVAPAHSANSRSSSATNA